MVAGSGSTRLCGAIAFAALTTSYLPTIRYYRLHPLWSLTLCPAACLFLAMTWTSARRYWSGERSRWKNRSYDTGVAG
jgi:hypothetical protein